MGTSSPFTYGTTMSGQVVKLNDKDAAKLWQKVAYYECDQYNNWIAECISNRSFAEGIQYTSEEEAALAARGQYKIVINKVRKAIKGISGLVTASIPKYRLTALSKDNDTKASIGNKILDWVWNNSNGLFTYKSIVKSALVDNMAYFYVSLDKFNRIKFSKLSFDDVIIDPGSKHPLFDDAEMVIIKRYVPTSYVKQVFGLETTMINEMPNSFYGLVDTSTINFLGKVFNADYLYVNLYECYRKVYNTVDTYVIEKVTLIGYSHAYVETLPKCITEYPIIPVYVDGHDNPYKRGEVYFLKEIQRFINKTHGVTLLNAQLLSNPKVFVRDIDIPRGDIATFESHYAQPASVNVLTGDAQPPMVVSGQPLNSAFYQLYLDAKSEFEWLTLPNQILGYAKHEQSSSQLLDVKENAIDSLRDFISILDLACSRLGYLVLQYAQAYIPKDFVINITDVTGAIERIKLNESKGVNVDDEQSVQQYIQAQKQNEVPDEEIQASLAKIKEDAEYVKALEYFVNDTDFSTFDVQVVPGSYSPSYQMAMLRLMMELTNVGAVDPSTILEYAPVENRQALIERFDTVKNLNRQVASMQAELESQQNIMESLQSKLVESGIHVETEKAKIKLDKTYLDAKLKAMRDKFLNMLKHKEQIADLENTITELVLNANHEIFKAKMKEINSAHATVGITETNKPNEVAAEYITELNNIFGDYKLTNTNEGAQQ